MIYLVFPHLIAVALNLTLRFKKNLMEILKVFDIYIRLSGLKIHIRFRLGLNFEHKKIKIHLKIFI